MEETQYQRLKQFLEKLSAGRIPSAVQPKLVELLEDCWDTFSGSTEERMEAYKIQRMENPEWCPPSLAFDIERHRGMTYGSSRAELQTWYVDIDRKVAECAVTSYRQKYPRADGVNVKPIADELVKLITGGSRDERLQWSANGRVRVLSGRVFPAYSAVKQTLEGRKNRLVRAMEERLVPRGWERRGSWWSRKS